MNDLASLRRAAYKTERAASRRLMSTGLSETEALRQTLTRSAGRQGLAALLDQRAALQQHVQNCADARADDRATARHRLAPAIPPAATLTQFPNPLPNPLPTPWRGWFDGSAHPNPGRCGIGAVLLGPAAVRIDVARAAGYGNSSVAEYRALIALLEAAVAAGACGLTVHGDSRVVIDDVALPHSRSAVSLRSLHAAVHALLAQLGDVRLRWIPRHRNGAADALSQQGSALHLDTTDAS